MRVIAGRAGGLRLMTLRGDRTRPTSDRVKESVFAILSQRLAGATVLDLYAGSGGLAIEALSRGASHALLVESAREAVQVIRHNLQHTGLAQGAEVWRSEVGSALRRLGIAGRRFSLVFADPPYNQGLARSTLQGIAEHGVLAREGYIVVEHACKEEMPLQAQNLTLNRQNMYGDTVISCYSWSESGVADRLPVEERER